jgi:hypothetical protein
MIRSRALLISCLLSASALTLYGLHRWPVERVSRYRGAGSEFVRGANPVDQLLGTVDFIAAALLFGVWPWVRIREGNWRKRWRPSDEKLSGAQKVEGFVVILSLFCAVMVGLMSVGAVISLIRCWVRG